MMIKKGFLAMLPTTAGVLPFGLVMGSVASNAGLDFLQTVVMNIFVFAGASQLAAVDLMARDVPFFIVVLTGVVINLRFMLYSAAISGVVNSRGLVLKTLVSYSLTDQGYAVLMFSYDKLNNNPERLFFYVGAAICMITFWQGSVLAGFVFGNFAPANWALDYAVPLSFLALVLPSLKSKPYYWVALSSSLLSLVTKDLPLSLGLLVTAILSLLLGAAFVYKNGRM